MSLRRVLVVDDEAIARMDMVERLCRMRPDCHVIGQANNGKDALRIINERSPDLVLIDIKMPVMDGIEVIRQAKESGQTCRFIVLSCFEEYTLVREALRLGADDYLLKHTCTDEELNTAVQRSLRALDNTADKQGKRQRLCQLLLQQMLTLTMSHEELNAYVSTGIFENRGGWYTLIQIQAVEHPDLLQTIPGYVTANGTDQEYWLLLCTEQADVRPILTRIREKQEKAGEITVYLQCHTDLTGFYQRYSELRQEQKGSVSRKIRQAIDYMRTHYADPVSVETTAQAVGISKTYLHQIFKAETGYSFSEWMQKCRMQKACELLCNTNLKIYEIAEMVGYPDSAYFSATFKKMLGVSPLQFREEGEATIP